MASWSLAQEDWDTPFSASRGLRPNDSKLQMKGEHSRRTARQQPYQTQSTAEATAKETVTLELCHS